MTNIYDLHTKAFRNVSAYVVLHKGEHVATIAFKFPADGAGRLYCYVHWLGEPMVRGFAGGCGYDKRSAAVANAVRKIPSAMTCTHDSVEFAFHKALGADSGQYWDNRLTAAGFTVLRAV